uniref:Uncharacterized protein n=1 Tax=Micrurus spixii TaxID=129469 RepID=A0A2D4LQU7_9SAUR
MKTSPPRSASKQQDAKKGFFLKRTGPLFPSRQLCSFPPLYLDSRHCSFADGGLCLKGLTLVMFPTFGEEKRQCSNEVGRSALQAHALPDFLSTRVLGLSLGGTGREADPRERGEVSTGALSCCP